MHLAYRLKWNVKLERKCSLVNIFFCQSLARKAIILLNKINIITYFENLIVKLHVLYVFKKHVKFQANRMSLFIILNNKNSKLKYLIDDVAINL